MKVLIIDDDEMGFKLLAHQLSFFNIESRCVLTVDEANEEIEKNRPSAIFLDLIMNGHNGIFFLKERCGNLDRMKIPVIVTSGKADLKTIRESIKFGANGYLIKPVQMKMLKLAIEVIKDFEK